MKEEFIPVKVLSYKKGKYEKWYLDIDSLELSELISLREEVKNTDSLSYLDRVISRKVITSTFSANHRREYHREEKRRKAKRKIKRNTHSYRCS